MQDMYTYTAGAPVDVDAGRCASPAWRVEAVDSTQRSVHNTNTDAPSSGIQVRKLGKLTHHVENERMFNSEANIIARKIETVYMHHKGLFTALVTFNFVTFYKTCFWFLGKCFITLLSYIPAVFDEIRGMKYCVLFSPVGRHRVKIENYGKYYNFRTAIT